MRPLTDVGNVMRAVTLAWLWSLPLLGCGTPASKPTAESTVEVRQQILAALKERRYADAIAATRRAGESAAETDFAVGVLVLEGSSDPSAVQAPRESVSDALALIEASALLGHAPAISTLASTFERGVVGAAGTAMLVTPDARLATCWSEARDRPTRASACAALRSGGAPPHR